MFSLYTEPKLNRGSQMHVAPTANSKIGHGQTGFALTCLALVLCGASAFSALYVVQPLLPWLEVEFDISMRQASAPWHRMHSRSLVLKVLKPMHAALPLDSMTQPRHK